MPLFCEICLRGPIVGYFICYYPQFPARRPQLWPISAPPINANAGFVYEVQKICLILQTVAGESNFRTGLAVRQQSSYSVPTVRYRLISKGRCLIGTNHGCDLGVKMFSIAGNICAHFELSSAICRRAIPPPKRSPKPAANHVTLVYADMRNGALGSRCKRKCSKVIKSFPSC